MKSFLLNIINVVQSIRQAIGILEEVEDVINVKMIKEGNQKSNLKKK